MTRITILGATGYAGAHIAREAAARGHRVTALSRTAPTEPIEHVTYVTGSALDAEVLASVTADAEAIVEALSPRGDMVGRLPGVVRSVSAIAAVSGARLAIVGGFSGLRVVEGGPRISEGEDTPQEFLGEAREMVEALDWLESSAPESLDWVFVSPAKAFGWYVPGERTGHYEFGGTVASLDSAISGEDFAIAIVDTLESGEQKGHVSVLS